MQTKGGILVKQANNLSNLIKALEKAATSKDLILGKLYRKATCSDDERADLAVEATSDTSAHSGHASFPEDWRGD